MKWILSFRYWRMIASADISRKAIGAGHPTLVRALGICQLNRHFYQVLSAVIKFDRRNSACGSADD